MPYPIHFTRTALAEIAQTVAWLSERSETAARRWDERITRAVESLQEHPERFGLAPEAEWYEGELRQVLVGKKRKSHRILFEVIEGTVYVHRIRHTAQDLLKPEEL